MPTSAHGSLRRLVAFTAVLVAFSFGHAIQDASASHLRYSSISAQSSGGTAYTVTFSEGQAGCASVGSSFVALSLFYGDGTSATPNATVASSACSGVYQWHYGSSTVSKTYASGLIGQTVTLYSTGGCRVTLRNSPAGCDLRSETSFVVGTGDSTPSVSVPPVVYCQASAVCTFAVPAADVDGDTLRWRMSTTGEAGGTGQPTGMSVNASTGLVTWDTTGLATGLWAANVTVEELDGSSAVKGKTSADFILAVGSYSLPTFVAPTPTNGTTFNLTQGDSFSLPLSVDAPSGQTVTLSSLGLPSWLSCSFPAAGANASVTCTGTAPSQTVSTTVVFLATSSSGPSSSVSFGINVSQRPTASNGTLSVMSGASASGSLSATSPDGSPLTFQVTQQATQGTATITNAATGAFTFAADAGAAGTDTFTFTATNAAGASNLATVTVTYTQSADATLSALVPVATMAPTFASGTTSYTATVSVVVTAITVTPGAAHAGATICVTINGGTCVAVLSGLASSALSLNEGANTIQIVVTAQDGSTTQTYMLTVTRAQAVTSPPPAPAPEPIAAYAVPPPLPPVAHSPEESLVIVPRVAGIHSTHTITIRVDNVEPGAYVRVFTNVDESSVQETVVNADGTITITLPDGTEGSVDVYVARVTDGATAMTTVSIDTIAPTLLSAVRVARTDGRITPTSQLRGRGMRRVWMKLVGTDSGSGVYSLQLSPSPGKVWAWRTARPAFSAPTNRDTIRVRIADQAGNVSGWMTVKLSRTRAKR